MTNPKTTHRRRSDISISDFVCAWGLIGVLVAALVLLSVIQSV